jgi:GNAT superfamily N-acetyltransferase
MAMDLRVTALSDATWPAYAALIARHNGVWGGCWCTAFHPKGAGIGVSAAGNRAAKEALVVAGLAQAALVFDDDVCVGWCQFGPAATLPRIKHQKAYATAPLVADWRITCLFVDKAARGGGVAEVALAGAIGLIAAAGGGLVESFPEEVTDRKTPAAFLHNGEVRMFDRLGFERLRKLGMHRWLVTRHVQADLI